MDIKNRKLSGVMEDLVSMEMKIERNLNWQLVITQKQRKPFFL